MKKGDVISRSAVLEAICRIGNLKNLLSMNYERRKHNED